MQHEMLMAYVRTQQSIFFHKLSSDHQNDNFEAFSRLNVADSSQNKYQFLSSLDFGQFHKCGSCSLKHKISSDFFGIIW